MIKFKRGEIEAHLHHTSDRLIYNDGPTTIHILVGNVEVRLEHDECLILPLEAEATARSQLPGGSLRILERQ